MKTLVRSLLFLTIVIITACNPKASDRMSFEINKKFLLVPIEDTGAESRLHLEVDGKAVSVPMDIRIAQRKTDYWVPIPVEQYKGKTLTLVFSEMDKSGKGYSKIYQSDEFNFEINEKYRPVYHFSPLYGWTNDPNGMVYHNGEYHLYYQHNPYGSMWGNMSWGHAVTKDLKNWEHQPVAILPDELGTIFSGSAVVDKDNTAGFGANAIVAIFTSAGEKQTQSIAYSTDNGRSFTKYENNPVLTDPEYIDFRDPKVFWHTPSGQWIMSLATTQVITFYSSPNLKEWTKLSDFGEGIGDHGGVWECPDLFPLAYEGKTKWVLLASINPGGPNGGSATQYFIGDFDGHHFKADDLPYPLWIDYGRDNYAGVTWNNTPGNRRIFIGWMSNWEYTNQAPTLHFRNGMTVPRELYIANNSRHLILANTPVKEMEELRTETISFEDIDFENSHSIPNLLENNTGAYEIGMNLFQVNKKNFEFALSNKKGEEIRFIFDLENEELVIDRSKSGQVNFSDKFAQPLIKSPLISPGAYKIRLLVDKASTELFINDGELVQTNTIFPDEPYNTLTFTCENEKLVVRDLKVYPLK